MILAKIAICLASLGGFNYDEIEKLKNNVAVVPPAKEVRSLFADASIRLWWKDSEGVHVLIARDKPTHGLNPKLDTWEPWRDNDGHPWLRKHLSAWEAHYWQANSWRTVCYATTEDWRQAWNAGLSGVGAPIDENYGLISGSKSGVSGDSDLLIGQPPCPGPGPCPKPGPFNPDCPILPPIQPQFNLGIDPVIVGAAIVSGFLILTIAVACVLIFVKGKS